MIPIVESGGYHVESTPRVEEDELVKDAEHRDKGFATALPFRCERSST